MQMILKKESHYHNTVAMSKACMSCSLEELCGFDIVIMSHLWDELTSKN